LKTKAPNTKCSNHLYNTPELLMMGIVVPETFYFHILTTMHGQHHFKLTEELLINSIHLSDIDEPFKLQFVLKTTLPEDQKLSLLANPA
jgi:hypothetical protein